MSCGNKGFIKGYIERSDTGVSLSYNSSLRSNSFNVTTLVSRFTYDPREVRTSETRVPFLFRFPNL